MKKMLMIVFIALYGVGLLAAVFILATGNKTQESAKMSNIFTSTLSSAIDKKGATIGLVSINEAISFNKETPSVLIPAQKGASYWLEQLNYAATNDSIKAVLIQVNSPGGTVGASQELHAAVNRIKEAGKPVITSVADLSASGGYYATVGSDRIFANSGSLVGSIGVILGGVEFSRLMTELGIQYQAITSGKNKDILSPFKSMSPEQRQELQALVNNTYNQFLKAVAEGRKKSIEDIRPLADGSIYTGEQAVKNGLVDEVGTFYDAIAYVKTQYELEDAEVKAISPRSSSFDIKDLISIAFSPKTPEVSVFKSSYDIGYSPILYLYQF